MAALAVAPPVVAEEPPPGEAIQLSWQAPAGCPDADAVRERLGRWASPSGGPVRVEARVQPDDDGFALSLRIAHGERTESRELASRNCEALARATGLVVAAAIDPLDVVQRLREPAAPPARPPVVVPVPVSRPARPERSRPSEGARGDRAPESARARAPRPASPVRFGLRPELLVGGGLLPGVVGLGVGGTLATFGRARPWRAELGGAYWFPRRAAAADATSAGGDIWLAHARASGCGVPSVRRVELPACAGVDLGAAGGRGSGEGVQRGSAADLYVGLHAGLGVAWAPIPALALFARLEAVVVARRPGFVLDGIGDVHRIGPAGARGAIGVEVRLPR